MITVRCPACDAAYQLDEAKLAGKGRKLKCARCQVVWVARAPEPEKEAVPVEAAVTEPATDEAVKEPLGTEDATAEAKADAEGEVEPSFEKATEDTAEEPYREPTLDELSEEVGGRWGRWRAWLRGPNLWRSGAMGLVAMGVLTGGGVLALKFMPDGHEAGVEIPVVAEPDLSAHVVQPPKGIVLHNVRDEIAKVEGDEQGGVALTVRGLLANTSSETLVVPPMRLELLGEDGKLADMWPVSGVGGPMDAGAEHAWTVSLSAPDMRHIKGWRVVFVEETQGAPAATSAE